MLRFILPHLRIESVLDLGVERLRELGLDSLLLDVDCTLKCYRDETVDDNVRAWLDELQAADIGLCLVSNGRGPRIARFAQNVGLPFVAAALKPLARGCRRAIREQGFNPKSTAIVGDQLFADIMAGRAAGLFSILVRPIHPEQEHWFTRIKRPPERWLLKWTKTDD